VKVAAFRALCSDEVKRSLNNFAIAIDRDRFYGKIGPLHDEETARVKRILRVSTDICWGPTQLQRQFEGVVNTVSKAPTPQLARQIGIGALAQCYSTKVKQLWYQQRLNGRLLCWQQNEGRPPLGRVAATSTRTSCAVLTDGTLSIQCP